MSHFAKINSNNIVTEVIVAEQDFINSGAVGDSFLWIQTSYNNAFGKRFGGVGHTYDKTLEAFIAPKPYPSWVLDAELIWGAPVVYPADAGEFEYTWDEDTTTWVEVT